MKTTVLFILITGFVAGSSAQQSAPPVEKYVLMVESGQTDPVKAELPALLEKYPNNPGVLYLQALLTQEGADAVRIYQGIVDNHPKSEWTDDALYKVYQFYHAIGLYRTAELKMNQLKRDYPRSKYVLGGSEVDTKNVPEDRPAPPAAPAADPQRATVPQGQFALQVGAYSTMVNAEKQKLFFEDLGYPVEVISKVRDGRSLFTVNIGNYATYDDAKSKSAEIKRTYNIDSFVVTR